MPISTHWWEYTDTYISYALGLTFVFAYDYYEYTILMHTLLVIRMNYIERLNHISELRADLATNPCSKGDKRKQLQTELLRLSDYQEFKRESAYEKEFEIAIQVKSWEKAYTTSGGLLSSIQLFDMSLEVDNTVRVMPVFKARTQEREEMHTPAHTEKNVDQSGHILAYCRVSTKDQSLESQTTTIREAYPNARIIEEHGVSGKVPAADRPAMSKLLDEDTGLRCGDTLVIWWFDRLGRDYHDAKDTAQLLLKRGVTIKTINQKQTFSYSVGDTTHNMLTDMMLTMLAGLAENERQARLASQKAALDAMKQDKEVWAEKYQGRKANTDRYYQLIELLNDGVSVRKAADKLGCNPSTVQRDQQKYVVSLIESGVHSDQRVMELANCTEKGIEKARALSK
ncbi:DNA invertase Pin-like site-specific DNA recombinase [Vibrio crassostreae]|nr:DNA invertase Pin-like site-specific DNA recombinase [Vibrio crassostreae]